MNMAGAGHTGLNAKRAIIVPGESLFPCGCSFLHAGSDKALIHRFPRLSIRAKLLIAFIGLSVFPVLVVGFYGLDMNVRTMRRGSLERLEHDVLSVRERTRNFMENVEGDLRILLTSATLEPVGGARRAREGEWEGRLRRFAGQVAAFIATKGIYYQVRILDDNWEETLRIECDSIPSSGARFSILPAASLRSLPDNFYRLLTQDLPRDQIVFTPVELVFRSAGRIPIISFASPLFDGGRRRGTLIADVYAGYLFRELESPGIREGEEKLFLVESDGHFLYDSGERENWNGLIATRQEENLQTEYPAWIGERILSGGEGIVESGKDIVAYAPLVSAARAKFLPGFTPSLFLFEIVSAERIMREARGTAYLFAGFILLFLGGSAVLGLLATRQFTHPIAKLEHGAKIIAGGNFRHRLEVETGDEIEGLARQFNLMAEALEQREAEIRQHRERLEEMVLHRTGELMNEKSKSQAIIDHVPSAFVLLDRSGKIQSASAAFSLISGLDPADAVGCDGRSLFRERGICLRERPEEIWSGAFPRSHVDPIRDGKGAERWLEHVTVPITDRGEAAVTLEILTDITDRKRLEEHLILSEKLMATGEMAAIVAHGFRNSLTSIKMILQLQQESRRIPAARRESLRVALDSIHRMETLVQDLLNFARPAPMRFGVEDLNAVVKQSIKLVEARGAHRRVEIAESFDRNIPPMPIDAAHLQEAIVNLLLNGIQSAERKKFLRGSGKLTVRTKQTMLARPLRDYRSSSGDGSADGEGERGEEILLARGSLCAIVSVKDNGTGIEPASLPRIFDPFFTTKSDGTGLGLSMLKRTVNAHGGIVLVKSAKGRGATFEILLPIPHETFAAADEAAHDQGAVS